MSNDVIVCCECDVGFVPYTVTLGTWFALTSSLRYVKLHTGYGGSSSNHTVFTISSLINFYLKCNT
jgi:hypothetical protein